MARKAAVVKKSGTVKKIVAGKGVGSKVASSTPVRNSAIPKVATKREITHEMIAVRAFEIAMGGAGGSELDNWYRAERELRAGL